MPQRTFRIESGDDEGVFQKQLRSQQNQSSNWLGIENDNSYREEVEAKKRAG